MKGSFLLDVVIGQRTAIFQLFTGKNKTLLIWWDTFFVLDLGFDVFNGIGRFDIKGDGFSSKGFDENLPVKNTKTKGETEVSERVSFKMREVFCNCAQWKICIFWPPERCNSMVHVAQGKSGQAWLALGR